jgi:hypothetical protein
MTPAEFVQKWRRADLPERAASHEHFCDLCRLLGHFKHQRSNRTGKGSA